MTRLLILNFFVLVRVRFQAASSEVEVHTSLGTIVGQELHMKDGGHVRAFRGIPFALPPTDSQRWAAPDTRLPSFDVPYQAKDFKPVCPDIRCLSSKSKENCTENCLYLNIMTPAQQDAIAEAPALPVVVFIAGSRGSPSAIAVTKSSGLVQKGVVFVSVQHRLDNLGFLTLPEVGIQGNLAVLDVVAALEWIRTHIDSFDGDPARVMLWGQAAGASLAFSLMVSPRAKGLFHRAALQNVNLFHESAVLFRHTRSELEQLDSLSFFTSLNCTQVDMRSKLACARELSWENVVNSSYGSYSRLQFDGDILPRDLLMALSIGNYNRVPVLLGVNSDAAQGCHMQTASHHVLAGCCFSIGYGSLQEPCCLRSETVVDVRSCKNTHLPGGASGYSIGNCPATAQEASDILHTRQIGGHDRQQIAEFLARLKPCCGQDLQAGTMQLMRSYASWADTGEIQRLASCDSKHLVPTWMAAMYLQSHSLVYLYSFSVHSPGFVTHETSESTASEIKYILNALHPSAYEVALEKSPTTGKLGLGLVEASALNRPYLKVELILDSSPAQLYNSLVEPERRIRRGDQIIAVNGVSQNIERMIDVLVNEKSFTLLLQKETNGVRSSRDHAESSLANAMSSAWAHFAAVGVPGTVGVGPAREWGLFNETGFATLDGPVGKARPSGHHHWYVIRIEGGLLVQDYRLEQLSFLSNWRGAKGPPPPASSGTNEGSFTATEIFDDGKWLWAVLGAIVSFIFTTSASSVSSRLLGKVRRNEMVGPNAFEIEMTAIRQATAQVITDDSRWTE